MAQDSQGQVVQEQAAEGQVVADQPTQKQVHQAQHSKPSSLYNLFSTIPFCYRALARRLLPTHRIIQLYLESGSQDVTYDEMKLTTMIDSFHAGKLTTDQKVELRETLLARLNLNETVNLYVEVLGINQLPPIEQWWEYQYSGSYSCKAFVRAYWYIGESGLLTVPFHESGHRYLYYQRPARYLAASMCLAKYRKEDIKWALRFLYQNYDVYAGYGLLKRANKAPSYLSKAFYRVEMNALKKVKRSGRRW